MRRLLAIVPFLAVIWLTPGRSLVAQQPASPAVLTDQIRADLVRRIAALTDSLYVFPDSGRRMTRDITARLERGEYSQLTAPADFAARLTADMRRSANDLHFQLLTPAASQQFAPPAGVRLSPGDRGPLEQRERQANFYFTRTELLPGGVTYIRLDQFPIGVEAARPVVTAIMSQAAASDAVIIDLRRNPGGGEGLNQLLSSYFYDADSTRVLYERHFREGNRTVRVTVLPDLPGPRLPRTPLYVLTSRRTGSAAENVSYHLQAAGRATIVGERTAGAANSSRPVSVAHGFSMVMPVAAVLSPITKSNWEGTGVKPNIVTHPDSALGVAYVNALDSLVRLGTSDPGVRAGRQRALEVARARWLGQGASDQPLAPLAGRYGTWTVRAAGRGLEIVRSDGPTFRVEPIGRDHFAVLDEPNVQFKFSRSGDAVQNIQALSPAGEWTTVGRTSP